jgi:hypothetical protein
MKRLFMLFGFLMLLIVPAFMQDTIMDTIVVIPPVLEDAPTDLFDAINLNKWLANLALLVGVVTFFATLVNGLLKTDKSWIRKAVAWVLALILVVIGKIFGIGFVEELNWIMVVVAAALAGFGANGLFDVPGLQNAWYLIESLLGNMFAKDKLEK